MTHPRLTITLGAALAVAAVVAGVRHRERQVTPAALTGDVTTGDDALAREGAALRFAYWTADQHAKAAAPKWVTESRWYDVKPGSLPELPVSEWPIVVTTPPTALAGDVTALSTSRLVYTGICPPCPKHPRRHETTPLLDAETGKPTGKLVPVHRKGQPPLPLNPNPYVPTMSCECPRCP